MATELSKLSHRIDMELHNIEKVIVRAEAGWNKYKISKEDFLVDSVALSLHGFYNGIEGLLEKIATTVNGHLPSGSSWHRDLLNQMAYELPNVRPAVISDSTLVVLDEYLRFRHVVRQVYSYRIQPDKLAPLAEGVCNAYRSVSQELTAFARWLVLR
ncbi:MAG: hypothetical protein AAFR18_18560 [Cyanobacteria bacterium J06627_32]